MIRVKEKQTQTTASGLVEALLHIEKKACFHQSSIKEHRLRSLRKKQRVKTKTSAVVKRLMKEKSWIRFDISYDVDLKGKLETNETKNMKNEKYWQKESNDLKERWSSSIRPAFHYLRTKTKSKSWNFVSQHDHCCPTFTLSTGQCLNG